MRKKIMNFAAVAVILFLGACSNQDEILTEKDTERTITIKASVPDEPTTYVGLEQVDKNIKLKWEVGDVLNLLFVQGSQRVARTVNLTTANITNEGKNAEFAIPVPTGATGKFTLYGVYGGGGINTANDIAALLPSETDITGLTKQSNVMLYFETTMQATDVDVDVSFKHLGSLFNISISNITPAVLASFTEPLAEIRLVGVDGSNENWAFNNSLGQYFDLESKEFKTVSSSTPFINYISFSRNTTITGGRTTATAWYPPLSTELWPELQLQLIGTNGTVLFTSTNTKERTTPTVAGKSYYLYASFGADNKLSFVAPF